ncbi:MAG: carboxymuconolactone decarboxylase family protein [Gemmatimonadales bacterium]
MSADGQAALLGALLSEAEARRLPLSGRELALVVYADQLTRAPASVRREDIDQLRLSGLDDRAIHDACAIVAYFAFVNRIADGLGVELEPPPSPRGS